MKVVDIHSAAQLKTMDKITSQCSFVIQEQIVIFPRTLIKLMECGQSCPFHCQTGHQSDKVEHVRLILSLHCTVSQSLRGVWSGQIR